MLGKLLKYEFKATARTFLPMYALLVVISVVNRIFMEINNHGAFNIPQGIAMFLFVTIIVAVFVLTFGITIQRFYKNLLTDEGYLMFTLPVKSPMHIWSKLIVASVWNTASVLMGIIAAIVLSAKGDFFPSLGEVFAEIGVAIGETNGLAGFTIFLFIVMLLVALVYSIINLYAAVAVGNFSSKHKLLLGVGAYIGFGVVQQIVLSIIFTIYVSNSVLSDWTEMFFNSLHTPHKVLGAMNIAMLCAILFMLVFGAIFYIITRVVLKKKLNLE